jgi:RHS repeat-associated protein
VSRPSGRHDTYRAFSLIEVNGTKAIRAWLIETQTDYQGNWVRYTYNTNSVDGTASISEITYGGDYNRDQTLGGDFKVTFDYANRPVPTIYYARGGQVVHRQRLTNIKTFVSGQLVKEYRVTYDSDDSIYDAIIRIDECDALGHCLLPTMFDWEGLSVVPEFAQVVNVTGSNYSTGVDEFGKGNELTPGDFNGDGLTDYFAQEVGLWADDDNHGAAIYFAQDDGSFSRQVHSPSLRGRGTGSSNTDILQINYLNTTGMKLTPGDFNGDGITDLLRSTYAKWTDTGNNTTLLMFDKSGNFTEHYPAGLINKFASKQYSHPFMGGVQLHPGDFNGDGLTDIFHFDFGAAANNNYDNASVYLSRGDGQFDKVSLSGESYYNDLRGPHEACSTCDNRYSGAELTFGDYNGDGRTDFIRQEVGDWGNGLANNFSVFFSDGDGTFTRQERPEYNQLYANKRNGADPATSRGGYRLIPGDFNGDGVSDFMHVAYGQLDTSSTFSDQGNTRLYISRGDGSFIKSNPLPNWVRDSFSLGDYNGDGFVDILKQSGANLHFFMANGNGTFQETVKYYSAADGRVLISGDFNGDGATDLLAQKVGSGAHSVNTVDLYRSQRAAPKITAVHPGLTGHTVELEYTNLTDSTTYLNTQLGDTSLAATRVGATHAGRVVKRHTVKHLNKGQLVSRAFRYYYQNQGLDRRYGYLGFEKMATYDEADDKLSVMGYEMDFPLSGLPGEMNTYHLTTPPVSASTAFSYTSRLLHHQQPSYSITSPDSVSGFPSNEAVYQVLKASESYSSTSQSFSGTLLNAGVTSRQDYTYNGLGQVIQVKDSGVNGTSTTSGAVLYSCMTYFNDYSRWHIGLLETKKSSNQTCGSSATVWNNNALSLMRYSYGLVGGGYKVSSSETWDDSQNRYITGAQYQYDSVGNQVRITDALGNVSATTYDYEYNLYPESMTTGGFTVNMEYDARFGLKTKATDMNGRVVLSIPPSGIDGFGRVTQVQSETPTSSTLTTMSTTQREVVGSDLKVTTRQRSDWVLPFISSSTKSEAYINALGQGYKTLQDLTATEQVRIDKTYDVVGRLISSSVPQLASSFDPTQASHYTYNLFNAVIKEQAPDGAVVERDYASMIYNTVIERHSSPTGSGVESTTTSFDNFGRTLSRTNAQGNTTTYTYDALGRMLSEVKPGGSGASYTNTYTYNSLGRVLVRTTPERGTTTFSYDAGGRLVSATDSKGQTFSQTYDGLNRPLIKTWPTGSGTASMTYGYDSGVGNKGRLTSVTTPNVDYNFGYDRLGQLVQKQVQVKFSSPELTALSSQVSLPSSLPNFTFAYDYNALGQMTQETFPDLSVIKNVYDGVGALSVVQYGDTLSNLQDYARYSQYNGFGLAGEVSYANGVKANLTYDELGRLTQLQHRNSGTLKESLSYSWNQANKLTSVSDGVTDNYDRNQSLSYDEIGRLDSANGVYGTMSYTYTPTGGMKTRTTTANGQTTTRTYNYGAIPTQLSGYSETGNSTDTATVSYDSNGNLSLYQSVSTAGNQTEQYQYDALDRMVNVNSGTQSNVYNDYTGQRLTKYDQSNGKLSVYIDGSYEVLADASSYGYTKYVGGPSGLVASVAGSSGTIGQLFSLIESANEVFHKRFLMAGFAPADKPGSQWFWLGLALLAFALNPRQVWMNRAWTGVKHQMRLWRKRNRTTKRAQPHQVLIVPLLVAALFAQMVTPKQAYASINGQGYPQQGQVLFFSQDHQGSTLMVTDKTGNEMARMGYEPFGAVDEDQSSGQDTFRAKYTGKERDRTNLYYFGSRYYHSDLGMFTSTDPAEQYHNPYSLGGNDPLSGVDPNGEYWSVLVGVVIGALVGAYAGGAIANHDANPANWDWKSGKTWVGIVGGAVFGGVSGGAAPFLAGLGLGPALTAGLTGGIFAFSSAATSLTAGAGIQDVALAGLTGGALGAFGSLSPLITAAGVVLYDGISLAINPSVEGGVALGLDVLSLGFAGGSRLYGRYGGLAKERLQGGCASFVENTQVLTEDGHTDIEEVEVGDYVWAYNEQTEKKGLYPVIELLGREAPRTILLQAGEETIETTDEHPFYIEGKGWVKAIELNVGDKMHAFDDELVTISAIEIKEQPEQVFNFEVDIAHNYYVSKEEVLVHNPVCSFGSQGIEPPEMGTIEGELKLSGQEIRRYGKSINRGRMGSVAESVEARVLGFLQKHSSNSADILASFRRESVSRAFADVNDLFIERMGGLRLGGGRPSALERAGATARAFAARHSELGGNYRLVADERTIRFRSPEGQDIGVWASDGYIGRGTPRRGAITPLPRQGAIRRR